MKLQGMGIVFALIVIPIILVLTYYIQLQVDTIALQNKYDNYLLSATHDALSSFEINTANEDLSSVSDSLRTIIEASSNVFFNTLSTNLGLSNASKSYVEPYIPALLYTLYDGYYIYSPTKVPTVLTDSDGNAVSVGDKGVKVSGSDYKYNQGDDDYLSYSELPNEQDDYGQLLYLKSGSIDTYTSNVEDADFTTKNVLKSYMPYSARYKKDSADPKEKIDVTITYSLDNFITIEGSIGDIYYTKSGYLLPGEDVDGNLEVTCITVNAGVDILNYNQNDAQKYIEDGNNVGVTINGETVIETNGVNYKTGLEQLNDFKKQLKEKQTEIAQINKGIATGDIATLTNDVKSVQQEINNIQYNLDKISAVVYYVKANIFSNWVYENLGDLQEKDVILISGQTYSSIRGSNELSYDFSNSDKKIFDVTTSTTEGTTEIAKDSTFYTHKLNVIRNSIQYNLNSAMSTYNNISASTNDYSMPVILDNEWDQILSNVSVVSFMQGYRCKLKIYNNYKIVSSTNNEISISPSNIYYVKKDEFSNENSQYHRIDCPELYSECSDTEYISFTSKEVKYDKIYDKSSNALPYYYDHKNLACYQCINDTNYDSKTFLTGVEETEKRLRTLYYTGLAKERNNLYKMNEITQSEGYEVVFDANPTPKISKPASLSLNKIKAIEIIFGTIREPDPEPDPNISFIYRNVRFNGSDLTSESCQIHANQTLEKELVINLDNSITGGINNIPTGSFIDLLKFYKEDGTLDNNIEDKVKYVRVIYK